ncbi:MAG TPA: ATP-binding cassette domain-containing protein [Candidatus Alectryocaccobium stercorigallinarum]|nr:ATP-binding cassette domain-containing protein [Candidatus Alectryocaccobium stercorigallinarum]
MLLDCQNITKSFGTNEIFHNISFHINENEKAALVGVNGCGKTTLLKIIVGDLSADSGNVVFSNDAKFGYLPQHLDIFDDSTIYEYMLEAKQDIINIENDMRSLEERIPSASKEELDTLMARYSRLSQEFELQNGYAYKSEVTGVMKGLGFCEEDFDRKVSTLSGGQKTRAALGRVLLTAPKLLILDEPTNHLDMESVSWLETRLMNYSGAVLIVSHDRYFLDRIVNKVIEIENRSSVMFTGNYTQFSEKKAVIRKAAYNAYIKQQQEIKRQEAVITKLKSFNREKSIKRAESREKMLDKMELLEKPAEINASMQLSLEPDIESGNDVLTVENISKSFSGEPLYEALNLEIHRGERVALIGNNGTGKTTLLKMITGLLEPDSGSVTFGSNVHIGYYDQEQQVLDPNKTIFDEISDAYPYLTETKIRNVCAAFLFTGDEVFTLIGDLSGGERGRVSLAKLMLSEANFLILDEPTNHLDMYSREILEEALNAYTGTVFFVSHDRYFINKAATKIVELTGRKLITYIGNYDYYVEKRDELRAAYLGASAAAESKSELSEKAPSDSALDWKAQKEAQAAKRKRENDIRKTEDKISELEEKADDINSQINLPENANDHVTLTKLTSELQDIHEQLDKLYELWEELASE